MYKSFKREKCQIAVIQPTSGEMDTFDIAGNTIVQISAPFEKDILKSIRTKKTYYTDGI